MTDVTQKLLEESSAPGSIASPETRRVARAQPPKALTTSLRLLFSVYATECRGQTFDNTMGHISKPLAYASCFRGSATRHADVIRLIKGGRLRIVEIDKPPPEGSCAQRDAPFGKRYYRIEAVETVARPTPPEAV